MCFVFVQKYFSLQISFAENISLFLIYFSILPAFINDKKKGASDMKKLDGAQGWATSG